MQSRLVWAKRVVPNFGRSRAEISFLTLSKLIGQSPEIMLPDVVSVPSASTLNKSLVLVTTCKNMVANTSDYYVEICKMHNFLRKIKQKYFNATLKSSQAKQFA